MGGINKSSGVGSSAQPEHLEEVNAAAPSTEKSSSHALGRTIHPGAAVEAVDTVKKIRDQPKILGALVPTTGLKAHKPRREANPAGPLKALPQGAVQAKPPKPTTQELILQKVKLLFGNETAVSQSTPLSQLHFQTVDLLRAKNVPLQNKHAERLLDYIHREAVKGTSPLPDKEFDLFLSGIELTLDRAQRDADVAKRSGDPEAIIALHTPSLPATDPRAERVELSIQIRDIARDVIGNDKISEHLLAHELLVQLRPYFSKLPPEEAARLEAKLLSTYLDADPVDADKKTGFNLLQGSVNRSKALLSIMSEAATALRIGAIGKTTFDLKKGVKFGEGGFGDVFKAELNGKPKLLKEFRWGAYPIRLDLSDPSDPKLERSNEVAATYLNELSESCVVAPTHLLVAEEIPGQPKKTYLVEVANKQFREWAKHKLTSNLSQPGYRLEVVGNVQDYAKGEELFSYLQKTPPRDLMFKNMKNIFGSYLDALSQLSERGFVHGDMKLANAFYDKSTGKISLIDTGSLTKISKHAERHDKTEFSAERGYTACYSTPNVAAGKKAGFEQDAFSTARQLLEVYSKAVSADVPEVDLKVKTFLYALDNRLTSLDPGSTVHEVNEVKRKTIEDLKKLLPNSADPRNPLRHFETTIVKMFELSILMRNVEPDSARVGGLYETYKTALKNARALVGAASI